MKLNLNVKTRILNLKIGSEFRIRTEGEEEEFLLVVERGPGSSTEYRR
jgi:hypothetical protein